VAKTLLTGATGFIGSHLARKLVERGDDLRLAVLPGTDTAPIDDLGCERAACDVLDRRAVRRALRGVGRVFHAAGVTSIDPSDARRVFEVNVGGTKTVLDECLRAGVERVVYTSSAAALGPASPGGTADEAQPFTAGRLGIPYVSSVHQAELHALRTAAEGLPVVCVNPSVVFGAGDVHLTSTKLVRRFLLGRVPVYVDGAFNMVDVEDVAAGHLLADERGVVGERYVLAGRNFTFDRLFADLGRLSGIEPPVRVPAGLTEATAALLGTGRFRSPLHPHEVRAASQWWTYSATKARRELGWTSRPHEETLEATVAWHLEREHERIARTPRSHHLQYRLAGAALGTLEGAAGLARGVLRRATASRR
jgi:dihydroflavonol-4-reductase